MLFELIAVVSAGFLGGGAALMLRRTVRTLPRWLVPVAAGSAMLIVAVSLEYSWFGRTTDDLPSGVDVALTHEVRAPWRPWTYAVPYVDRFIAVDRGSIRTHDKVPDQRLADLIVFARWQAPTRVRAVFDCATGRRADLTAGVRLAEDGTLEGATWYESGRDNPVVKSVCT
ncbi:hypothetical protein DLJ53_28630 [Acuticoccus sediminis]|uniref:Uncharacterized protein n=1 Tax=Acuticoccus sediminis TaxID=2184697 RepID=A0A8B2NID9_9HYPH|nr:hypothetical protein [Acuticoccus sediminis]RAH97804.1 hypothetical protein DLJ53_28630 [Acuticoccus sediminis]